MSANAIALVLAAACIHASWNLLAKRVRGGMETVWIYSAIGTVFYAPWALTEYSGAWARLGFREAVSLAGSCAWQMLYFICLQQAYKHGDLSLVYPVARGSGPLVAALGALWLFHETATGAAWAGIALICLGVLLFLRFGEGGSKGVLWGLATGVCIGLYSLWDKYAISGLRLEPVLIEWTTDLSRAVFLFPVASGKWREPWQANPRMLIAIAILNPLSYILVLTAMASAPLHRIAPMRELSIVLGAVLGARFLGERQPARRIAGACVIAAGVMVLALSR
ncbi:MAG: EamA family transporter [Acidobacteria bacterium]|nr:EamA family transporter [Acidobacteriota bacterium]